MCQRTRTNEGREALQPESLKTEVNEGDLTKESVSKVIYKEAVKNDCDGLESLRQKIQIARFYFCRQSPRGARVVPERDGVRIYAIIQNRSETKEIMDGRFLPLKQLRAQLLFSISQVCNWQGTNRCVRATKCLCASQ